MDAEQRCRDELNRLLRAKGYQWARGVRVRIAEWPEGRAMAQLHDEGQSVQDIAARFGRSVRTVESNLVTRGRHPRCGPQCESRAREYSFAEVEQQPPLPCSANCVCDYELVRAPDECAASEQSAELVEVDLSTIWNRRQT